MGEFVSIIVPVKVVNDYIRDAMHHYAKMEYSDWELLIFPDAIGEKAEDVVCGVEADTVRKAVLLGFSKEKSERKEWQNAILDKIRIIASGKTGPAEKRDMSLKYGKGSIIAFIDDDAYPREDWLKNAVRLIDKEEVGAVGGPAVTAPEDNVLQQASGKTYESFLTSAGYSYRYIPGKAREVDDLPSVNLIVKRDVFEAIGGYDSNYWPGEDTKLCLDIVKKQGKKILYDPDIYVYHHRRTLFRAHLKQSNNYGKHRGYFAKKLPQTSRRFSYFVPSLFVLGIVVGPILSFVFPVLWYVYFGILLLYLFLVMISIRKPGSFKVWILTVAGIIVTHIGYGINFIGGLCAKEMPR